MKRLNCEEICIQKFSSFSAGRVHSVLVCLLGCLQKKNLGEPNLQYAASDRHHHTLRGHNLYYTIWILYAESVSSQQ